MKLIIEKSNSDIFAYMESDERFEINEKANTRGPLLPKQILDDECDLYALMNGHIVFDIQDDEPIYAVYASGVSVDRDYLLCYAKGKEKDIKEFYKDKQGYGLFLEKVKPIVVPSGYADKRGELEKKRAELESELKKLDNEIKLLK